MSSVGCGAIALGWPAEGGGWWADTVGGLGVVAVVDFCGWTIRRACIESSFPDMGSYTPPSVSDLIARSSGLLRQSRQCPRAIRFPITWKRNYSVAIVPACSAAALASQRGVVWSDYFLDGGWDHTCLMICRKRRVVRVLLPLKQIINGAQASAHPALASGRFG